MIIVPDHDEDMDADQHDYIAEESDDEDEEQDD